MSLPGRIVKPLTRETYELAGRYCGEPLASRILEAFDDGRGVSDGARKAGSMAISPYGAILELKPKARLWLAEGFKPEHRKIDRLLDLFPCESQGGWSVTPREWRTARL